MECISFRVFQTVKFIAGNSHVILQKCGHTQIQLRKGVGHIALVILQELN